MVRIHTDLFPFVIAVVAGNLEDSDFEYMYEQYRAIHARDQRFYLAQETRRVRLPNALQRRQLGELNAHFAPDIEKRVVQIGVIVASKVFAGAIRAIYWLSREAKPTYYASTAVECWDNAERLCRDEGLVLPAPGRAFAEGLDAEYQAGGDFSKYLVG